MDKQAFTETNQTTQQQNLEPCFFLETYRPSRTTDRVGVPRYRGVKAAGFPHMIHTSSNAKTRTVGDSMPSEWGIRERVTAGTAPPAP